MALGTIIQPNYYCDTESTLTTYASQVADKGIVHCLDTGNIWEMVSGTFQQLTNKAVVGVTPTQGSIVFAGPSGVSSQNNSNLFWDNTNNYLGIGTATPGSVLDVRGGVKLGPGTGGTFDSFTNTNTYVKSAASVQLQAPSGSTRFTVLSTGLIGVGITPIAGFDVGTAMTAASGVAYGTRLLQSLNAAANNDTTYGLYLSPTFTNGAFTGVTNIGFSLASPSTATSGVNYSPSAFQLKGSYWNGTAGTLDSWTIQSTLGTGTNPTSTLAIAHSGTSGATTVQVPALNVQGTVTLGSASFLQVPAVLATVTGINAFTVANTLLYTVPTGKTLVVTAVVIRCTSATGTFTSGPTIGIGNASGTSNIYSAQALGSSFNAALVTFNFPVAGGISLAVAAGGNVYLNNTVAPTGGTAQIYQADLIGYLE